MKKSLFYFAVATALCTACQLEFFPVDTPSADQKHKVTILASVDDQEVELTTEGKVETKTTVDGSGLFSWQAGEKVKVLEQDAAAATAFDLEDADNGTFSGTKTEGKDLLLAISPASAVTAASAGSSITGYTIVLPTYYEDYVPGTTNNVMIGTPNGMSGDDYKFSFRHATALLKFTYVNVPIGTKKFILASNADIAGTWSDITSASGVKLTDASATSTSKTVTLELEDAVYEANQTMEFCVPVPETSFTSFDVQLQDKSSALISGTNKSKTSLDFALHAGDIFPCPTVSLPAATKGSTWNPTLSTKDDLSTSGATLGGLTVTSTVSAGSFETSGSARGCQFSSGADPTITIPYTDFVESVTIVCSANNAASTVAVTVDDIAIGSAQSISNGVANETHTFKIATNGHFRKGNVKVIITNTNDSKSTWIKSITINGDVRDEAGLSYEATAVAKATGAANFTNTLSNPNSLTGIIYSSSDTDVATVNSSAGEVTVVAAGEATITASFAGDEYYKAGNASYTLTVAAAYVTLPEATTPAKADCLENSTVSFDVDSNIEWTAAKGTDANDIIKSVGKDGNTVTVTFNANAGAEKTAEVTITPVEVGYRATLTKSITVTQKKYEKVDVLTHEWTGIGASASGYKVWSNKEGSVSDAVYAGQSYDNASGYIQIRATSPSGIVSTTSGGSVTKVAVSYAAGNSNGRRITVFGKNTTYSGPSDLYDDDEKGTVIGTITFATGDTDGYLDIDDYYEYVGIWSGDGAMYFSEIDIHWDNAKADPSIAYARTSDEITYGDVLTPPAISNTHELTITCSSSNTDVATVNASTGAISVVGNAGETTITASWDEQTISGTTYRSGTATYTLTINKATPVIADFVSPTTSVAVGSTVTNTTTITPAGLAITYVSSNTSYATVNSSTGQVTGVADGLATISATFTGNANYNPADSKSYSITVGAGGLLPLDNPDDVTITTMNASSFTATWKAADNASSYAWILSDSSTAPASTSDSSVKAYGTSASDCSHSGTTWTLTKTSLTLSGKYYLYVKAVGDGVSYTDSGYSSKSAILIILDCSTNIFSLTSSTSSETNDASSEISKTVGDYTYKLSATNSCSYYNSKALFIGKSGSYITFPAISGYKLCAVSATNCKGAGAPSVLICSTSSTTAITNGSSKTLTADATTSWTNLGSSAGTSYRIYINSSKNAQFTNITLVYFE